MIFSEPSVFLLLILLIPMTLVLIKNIRGAFSGESIFKYNRKLSNKAFFKSVVIGTLLESAYVFLIIAAARPSWGKQYSQEEWQSVDVAFAVDVSRSMLMDDVYPTRLGYAASVVRTLLTDEPGIRYSLTALKGGAIELIPMTEDREALRLASESLSPNLTSSTGTDLGGSLKRMTDVFPDNMQSKKIIVLLTDGVDGIRGRRSLCEEWKKQDAVVYAVCIGTDTQAPLKDEFGQPVLYRNRPVAVPAEPDDLRFIAVETGGQFFESGENLTVSRLRKAILNSGEFSQTTSYTSVNRDDSRWFAFGAFFCLCLASAVRIFLWRKDI